MLISGHNLPVGVAMKAFTKLAVAAGCAMTSFVAMAAFTPGMNLSQIDTEVRQSIQRGDSLSGIAAGAKRAGVSECLLVSSLISQGQSPVALVSPLISSGYSANAVVNCAVASGADSASMVSAAIAAGADPTTLTAATASGQTGTQGGGGIAGGGSGGFGGGAPSSVSFASGGGYTAPVSPNR